MLAAGFVGYIPKPIATRSFAREVEAIVSREAPPTVTPGA
jgi:DNA-binding response OmpR family regulator